MLVLALALAAAATADPDPSVAVLRVPDTDLVVEFVRIPAGERPAQGDQPAQPVPAFWMARTELTWDLYDRYFLGFDLPMLERAQLDGTSRPSKPYGAVDRGFGHRGFPALGMTRLAAEGFCHWLGELTGHPVRLPTEDEWTLAAGGFDGRAETPLAERAWFFDNARDKTHKVGKLDPNARGLHDMLGNAAEWVAADPDDPERFVICGGSFLDFAEDVHPLARQHERPAWKATDPQIPKSRWWFKDGPFVGMRLATDAPPGVAAPEAEHDEGGAAAPAANPDAASGDARPDPHDAQPEPRAGAPDDDPTHDPPRKPSP